MAVRANTVAAATGGKEEVGKQSGLDYKQAMGASMAAIGAISGMTMNVQANQGAKAAEKQHLETHVKPDAQMEAIIDEYLLRETEMPMEVSMKSRSLDTHTHTHP